MPVFQWTEFARDGFSSIRFLNWSQRMSTKNDGDTQLDHVKIITQSKRRKQLNLSRDLVLSRLQKDPFSIVPHQDRVSIPKRSWRGGTVLTSQSQADMPLLRSLRRSSAACGTSPKVDCNDFGVSGGLYTQLFKFRKDHHWRFSLRDVKEVRRTHGFGRPLG